MVGCWHVHAGDYARAAQQHPETQLVAVWDDDAGRGMALARDFGVPYTPDLGALLSRDDVDGITITTATSVHRDVMIKAARAGKHIFTEKLLAPTVAECEDIISAADDAGIGLVVSLPRLYAGYTRTVAEIISSGRLGRLTYARVRLSHDGATTGWLPERFFDPEAAIGGALTDLGCHPAYLVQRFLGARPAVVAAVYRSLTGRAVEDHAVATVGYAEGAIGVIEAGFVSRNPFVIEVHGTEASLIYTDVEDEIRVRGAPFGTEGWQVVPTARDGPDPFTQWVESIRSGRRADDNLSRALDLTRLVVAINEAAKDVPVQSL